MIVQKKDEGIAEGLNDLYVRFFRMAERRIAEKTGQGVVCFISNYSWLDGLSFTGMRERYLESFDAIRIDCLNGDKYKTGKVAPDGSPDPSIFSTEGDPVGIQVGTAIATLVRKSLHSSIDTVEFRHLWGQAKREQLLLTAEEEPAALYARFRPVLGVGLPMVPTTATAEWFDWPSLSDLFPISFPGVTTSRDGFLIDIDLDRLRTRVSEYFDVSLSHDDIAKRYPTVMKQKARFNARAVRETLLARGGPNEHGFIRFAYRPFDERWLYWEKDTKLLDEKRADYKPHVFDGNLWIECRTRDAKQEFSRGTLVQRLAGDFGNGRSHFFPAWLRQDGCMDCGDRARLANVSEIAQRYLDGLGLGVDNLFFHVVAVLHDPGYRTSNAETLRIEWPRIPLPGWPDGRAEDAAEALVASAARGRKLAALLDADSAVPGITEGTLRRDISSLAVPATKDGRNMTDDDFAVTAGWGHFGAGDAVMPGQGRIETRPTRRTSALRSVTPSALLARIRWTSTSMSSRTGGTCRPRCGVQARRVPGAQEVALVPRARRARPSAPARRGAVLHEHGAADRGDPCGGFRRGLGGGRIARRRHQVYRMPRGPHFVESKGACIYCGATQGPLSDEHVLPYSLGGSDVLRKASCARCAAVTTKFERRVARGLWGEARTAFNAPTRRRKMRSTELVMPGPSGRGRGLAIPAEEYPAGFVFYTMCQAGILQGLPADSDVSGTWKLVVIDDDQRTTEFQKKHPSLPLTIRFQHVPKDFGRLLAKVGYGHLLTQLDPGDFRPLCVPYILGHESNISYVVGGTFEDQVPQPGVGYSLGTAGFGTPDKVMLVALVRLLANTSAPAYHVVVGDVVGTDHVARVWRKLGSPFLGGEPMEGGVPDPLAHWSPRVWPLPFWDGE